MYYMRSAGWFSVSFIAIMLLSLRKIESAKNKKKNTKRKRNNLRILKHFMVYIVQRGVIHVARSHSFFFRLIRIEITT